MLENCNADVIRFTDMTGTQVSIKNSSVYTMDLRDSHIDHLVLDNVTLYTDLKYSDAIIGEIEQHSLIFGHDINIDKEGSDIEIKPNTILEN